LELTRDDTKQQLMACMDDASASTAMTLHRQIRPAIAAAVLGSSKLGWII
jgi:hypothetical protein